MEALEALEALERPASMGTHPCECVMGASVQAPTAAHKLQWGRTLASA